ncbi:Nuclear polyadenylated RNA-binding protein NAB2 [Erysiphe necator]|nr:Nuclear polyadenylated RNA-binding protein NAB2 [Erysiphe necator]
MTVEVILETPLAQALNTAIQPKLIEVGWSAGDDATALSEYIILMLVNGKNQQQIASELAGDLLQLGPDDPGAREFSQWLFQQIELLDSQINGGGEGNQAQEKIKSQADQTTYAQTRDSNMGDYHDNSSHVPTGPKSMRNGTVRGSGRDKRIMNHISKAMDRSHDSVLHRVRTQAGTERIGRVTPTGPRQQAGVSNRGGLRIQNSRINSAAGSKGTFQAPQNGPALNLMKMGPEQQLELYAMLENQSRMMAQLIEAQGHLAGVNSLHSLNGGLFPHQPQNGRSLFERAQPKPRGGLNEIQRGLENSYQYNNINHESTSAMDVDIKEKRIIDPDITTCKYNLNCTNKDCKFAHQSPAAPAGTNIDYKDTCTFGAACKNRKCTGKHPSPAQKIAHQTELDCKYFPNCTNLRCPFKHPTMPLCRNGAECITSDCMFTHLKTMCKFNPCLNPSCTFKHIEGQKRGKFEDKVWTSNSKEHVSERKFVQDTGPEELIVSGTSGRRGINQMKTELAT